MLGVEPTPPPAARSRPGDPSSRPVTGSSLPDKNVFTHQPTTRELARHVHTPGRGSQSIRQRDNVIRPRDDVRCSYIREKDEVKCSPVAASKAPALAPSPAQRGSANLARQCDKHLHYVEFAKCAYESMVARAPEEPFFMFVMMANKAFLPLIQNWLCNTARMEGVHERTLLIFSDDGWKSLSKDFAVRFIQAHNNLPREYHADMNYNTYGYWRLVQLRVQVVVNLVNARIPFLLFEPDALWVENPLKDPALWTGEDLVGFDDHKGRPGFGWLRIWPTLNVRTIFAEMEQSFSSQMPQTPLPVHDYLSIDGEQDILHSMIQNRDWKSYKNLQFKMLPQTKYVSGKWYDGGRGGDGEDVRQAARFEGIPFVINNNWIVGNAPKIVRAKRWGHWFIQDETSGTCTNVVQLDVQLSRMLSTMKTLQPMHGPPMPSECPLC